MARNPSNEQGLPVNPGGTLDPAHVVGRDELITELWARLQRQSLVITSERRMGKTSIIKKMSAAAPPSVLAFYRDLEGINSPVGFVERVAQDIDQTLQQNRPAAAKFRNLCKSLGGLEIAGVIRLPAAVQSHWQEALERLLTELHAQNPQQTCVFFWDEVPWMLQKIHDEQGAAQAIALLDGLRQHRQSLPRLRMVYTGSIGLYHVVSTLKATGYVNEPVNDMYTVDLQPLTPDKATELARRLMLGKGISGAALAATALSVATLSDGLPFVIHHLVDGMAHGSLADPQLVPTLLEALLVDDHNRLDLQHYDTRLDAYYGAERAGLAREILDLLARRNAPVSISEVLNGLPSLLHSGDRPALQTEALRALIRLLQRDHYLHQLPGTSTLQFRFPMLQRWWTLYRGLP